MNKRTFLPAVFVITALALSGCGNDSKTTDHDAMDTTPGTSENTTALPGQEILGDDVVGEYGLDENYKTDDLTQYKDEHTDEHLEFGIPLDDMLDNAYVHDTDGNLNDGENAQHDDFFHYEPDNK